MSDITIDAAPDPVKRGKYIVVSENGRPLHRDTIDLNSAVSRQRFVGATLRAAFPDLAPDDWPADVRKALDDRLTALAAAPPGAADPPPNAAAPDDPRAAALEEVPADVRAEAGALLADPRLMERVAADIEAVGVAGERRLAFTLYLVGVSAQLPRPLAAIVRGSSSSGKSYVVGQVATLFPDETVLHATSITTNALYYFEPGTLRHRWVVAGERSRVEDDDKAEATRALREMIEAGRLSKAVPVKEREQIVTKVIEQEGPIAYVETTTLTAIFGEDANRCLLLGTDEREEQTKLILQATARAAAGGGPRDPSRVRAVHHALNRMVPRADVVVPFAEHVSALYPTAQVEARRSYRHVLQLVRASALLHFRQRDRDAAGRVVATVADYAVAERLARAPLAAAAGGITDGAVAFLAALREKFGTDTFSTADAQKVGGGSRRAKYGRINELFHAGAVEQTDPPKGKVPARWRLTGEDPTTDPGLLPQVKAVMDRVGACTGARET